MKKFLKKSYDRICSYVYSNRLFLSYFLLAIFALFLVKYNTVGVDFLIRSAIVDIGLVLIIGSFCYILKPKNQIKYLMIILAFICLICIIDSIYYMFYTSFSSVGDLATLSQVETVTGSIFEKVKVIDIIFALFPLVLYGIHRNLLTSPYYSYIQKSEKWVISFFITFLLGCFCMGARFHFATETDYNCIVKQYSRASAVKRFGVLFYHGNDIYQTIKPQISGIFGKEDAIELFNNYFGNEENQKYKDDNKYTGILEGKNVIFVHMESIEDFVMDLTFNGQELTPNLNKMAKEGMFFTNFYPEVATGTSSDTEFSLLSSLMPASRGTAFVTYYKNNYITIPKLLIEKGYNTFSMHGNDVTMWNRNKAHKSLGYQDLYFKEYFTFTEEDIINLGINDTLFFEQAIPLLEKIEDDNQNYMGTVITLSNHSPYSYLDKYGEFDMSTTYIDEETGEEVKTDYLENTAVGKFLHSVHYADQAMGRLMELINESDHFNDTVFVFYGDHDAKLSMKQKNYLYNYNYKTGEVYTEEDEEYTTYNSYLHELNKKTPLIIWTKNKDLRKKLKGNVDYYMGMIDVAPTILNMLGMENKYALGHDIFTIKDDNTVPFPSGNFLTNIMYYNSSNDEYYITKENTIINDEYISEHKKYTENLLDVSNAIITYNLFDTVNKAEENNEK
jgi:phosphoglycerol transferase MdoB-like AlkP superfamily enzyme